jgi:hypothetical protein
MRMLLRMRMLLHCASRVARRPNCLTVQMTLAPSDEWETVATTVGTRTAAEVRLPG